MDRHGRNGEDGRGDVSLGAVWQEWSRQARSRLDSPGTARQDIVDMEANMTSTERAVRDGVAMLDEHRPGWAHEIDTHSLDMAFVDSCVLGHLYGGYVTGLIALCGRDRDDWALDHGFTLDADGASCNPDLAAAWRPLTQAWIRVIEERQQPDWTPSEWQGSQHARV